jgi:hypothetical protein
MNNKTISGKMAAPNHAIANWPDDWVPARVVVKRFGFCERTLRTYVAHGMPNHLIGKRQMRFVLREVYDWLVREGALRFAGIGLANTRCESMPPQNSSATSRSVSVTVPAGLEITQRTP